MTVLSSSLLQPAEQSPEDMIFPVVAGALIGAAVGDALGWITEFVRGPDHLRKLYKTDHVSGYRPWQKTTGGRFNAYTDYISNGEYSDDTQLTLAVARSIRQDGSVDLDHFTKLEMPLWLDYARGAGSTITAAARSFRKRGVEWNSNFFTYSRRGRPIDYRDSGANGSAMRVSPIALANLHDPATMVIGVWKSSIATHGHPRAILGSLIIAEALRHCSVEGAKSSRVATRLVDFILDAEIPEDLEVASWIRRWNDSSHDFVGAWETTKREAVEALRAVPDTASEDELQRFLKQLGCFSPETKGSGIGTAIAAIAIFNAVGDDFSRAITFAVNCLGADTDTIAAFVGGLCGAAHGYDDVPREWAGAVQDYDYFMRVATELARIALRAGSGKSALLPDPDRQRFVKLDLLNQLRKHELNKDERVFHPLFGEGWVSSVEAQKLQRKDGGQVVLAWVRFDIGQSCKFRYITLSTRSGSTTPKRSGVDIPRERQSAGQDILPL